MKLSIIIVSYNVKPYLVQCVQSVEQALEGIEAEVFVVDNASGDDSVETVRHLFPRVHLLANLQNRGFSHANNQALALARGEYVLLLNPDTLVPQETLKGCIEFMDAHRGVASTGVKMLNRNGTFAMESRRGLLTPWVAFCKATKLCRLFPHSRLFGGYYMSYLDKEQANPIDMVSGAFMFMRRTALEECGHLDEQFFLYWEDTDLSYRMKKGGYQNYYLPLRLFHYKGESSVKSMLRYRYYLYSSTLIFLKKHTLLNYRLMYLPIKAAILLCKFRIHVGNRLLYGKGWEQKSGERPPCFVVLGDDKAIEEIKQLCAQEGLSEPHLFVTATQESSPRGHLSIDLRYEQYTHLLYAEGSYSYSRMLELLEETPGHPLKLATYSPRTRTLITDTATYTLPAQ